MEPAFDEGYPAIIAGRHRPLCRKSAGWLATPGLGQAFERIESVDNLNLPEFYNKADFLLHFSDFETFSIVPLEALACGCPVIASRVGVLPEYINDSNGKIVENDTLEIVASLEKSIHIKYSRMNISDQITNKFSKDYVSKLFKEIIDEI